MVVEINKKELAKFKKFVKRSYPNECCGFLLGDKLKTKIVIKDIYIPQNQEKYSTPDKIDVPIDWWDEADEKGNLLGFIHSHPDYRDVSMSEADLALTSYIKTLYPDMGDPIMGVVGIYKTDKRTMTKLGIWPMFDQFKICQT